MTKDEIKEIVKEAVSELLQCQTCKGAGEVEGWSSRGCMVNVGSGKSFIKCYDCDGTGLRMKFK